MLNFYNNKEIDLDNEKEKIVIIYQKDYLVQMVFFLPI